MHGIGENINLVGEYCLGLRSLFFSEYNFVIKICSYVYVAHREADCACTNTHV